jgi:hypothetical protein
MSKPNAANATELIRPVRWCHEASERGKNERTFGPFGGFDRTNAPLKGVGRTFASVLVSQPIEEIAHD